jgi:putative toxin-antitoxin system antitoxin component (TIGR02293 family)
MLGMKILSKKAKTFNVKRSLKKSVNNHENTLSSSISTGGKEYTWNDSTELVSIVREGLPFGSVEYISNRLEMPVKGVLAFLGMPQTTYNKKKSENAMMDGRDAELLLRINELIDFGQNVFNQDSEKFHRWLHKQNTSLGGHSPDSLFDTITGIEEVRSALERLNSGNLA